MMVARARRADLVHDPCSLERECGLHHSWCLGPDVRESCLTGSVVHHGAIREQLY